MRAARLGPGPEPFRPTLEAPLQWNSRRRIGSVNGWSPRRDTLNLEDPWTISRGFPQVAVGHGMLKGAQKAVFKALLRMQRSLLDCISGTTWRGCATFSGRDNRLLNGLATTSGNT